MAFPIGWPLARRLAIEVVLPSLVVSFVMTGLVYAIRLSPPLPAEARQLEEDADAGLRAVPPDTTMAMERHGPDLPGASDATSGEFRVRVGVFRILSNAVAVAEDLRRRGYRPEVVPRPGDGAQVYYVYAASFDDRAGADAAAARLEAAGIDVWIEQGPFGSE